jgi:hypothetical protein
MKTLDLTEEQKSKLVEMSKDLFPEYDTIVMFNDDNKMLFLKGSQANSPISWFELCIIHLPKRIAENFNTVYPKEKHALIIDLMMKKMLDYSSVDKTHPVDYLYEMYQKTLENEK